MGKGLYRGVLFLSVLGLIGVLVVGVMAGSTSDPDWAGTPPKDVSQQDDYHRAQQTDISVAPSGEVIVVWSDKLPQADSRDIFYRERSGDSWLAIRRVAQTDGSSSHPDVLTVGSRRFVAWLDLGGTEPNVVYETELGMDSVREVSSPVPPVDRSWAQLVGNKDKLHIVFGAGGGGVPDIYYASRDLSANDWPEAELIYDSGSSALWPDLALSPDGSHLHLVWQEKDSVRYMSGDVGANDVTWSGVVTISEESNVVYPKVAVNAEGEVHVAWAEKIEAGDDQPDYYIRYRRREVGGNWSPSVRIDSEKVQSNPDIPLFVAPSLALTEKRACIAWYGFRDRAGDPEVEEVLLRCSRDGGSTWAGETVDVSRTATDQGSEISMRPSIAFDASGRIHAAWQEHVGGDLKRDYEIYYAHELSQVFLPLVLRSYR
jgi:hypothetical protein